MPEPDTMTSAPILLTEVQLADRWQMSRSRLEAWRLQGEGPRQDRQPVARA